MCSDMFPWTLYYLLLEAHSFPRASLSENCSLISKTNNVRRQISEHILAPNGGYCLYIQWSLLADQIPGIALYNDPVFN